MHSAALMTGKYRMVINNLQSCDTAVSNPLSKSAIWKYFTRP